MKNYLLYVLAISLAGASVAGTAPSASMDHSAHGAGPQGMMGMESAAMQAMQEKMSAAKTDEERQALMAEQQKSMQDRHARTMSPHAIGHDRADMPGNMVERQQMMRKRMEMRPL